MLKKVITNPWETHNCMAVLKAKNVNNRYAKQMGRKAQDSNSVIP